jgi:hypothetical protein
LPIKPLDVGIDVQYTALSKTAFAGGTRDLRADRRRSHHVRGRNDRRNIGAVTHSGEFLPVMADG